ncbi:MlaE family ABC transporter permease [Thermospira aquatica]|uniref:ABC transporter permease n=1 Tax=Thermospira aquatica TaxID=2828656 RepID=A0AAX3BBR6_9SPIR|nr:ABC transporter permease [Thermospira aquatica]URA09704.1 ABC transporter permease [Thermospira aquatica]
MGRILEWFSRQWTGFRRFVRFLGGIYALIVYSIKNYFGEKKGRDQVNAIIVMQMYFTGVMAVKIISFVALALGAITILQGFTQLSRVGALDFVGRLLNIVIVRELGPVLTAFIVLSRSGTAIAAEIGTMMVNDEVNALEIQGIDTLKFIVFPRITGMVLSLVLLNIYFSTLALVGGFVVANIVGGVSYELFFEYVFNSITLLDILASFLKCVLFGIFIATVSVFHGFQAFVSTQIPQVTTAAVMSSISVLFVLDAILTVIFYI